MSGQGHIVLVGAGPGARDLLTMRAMDRIAAADVVLYDRLVDEDIRALIPKHARQINVGKAVGAHAWPQDRINARIVAEAQRGLRVVRLKSGDPGVFGRAGEEVAAAEAAGVPVEIVPGITAASAAAAHMGRSLTERGVTDTLVLTTGRGQAGDDLPDCTRMSGPGTTTVFYMSVRQAARVQQDLLRRGLPFDAPVRIGIDVSKSGERLLECPLSLLSATLSEAEVTGCAVLMVTWPKAKIPVGGLADNVVALSR